MLEGYRALDLTDINGAFAGKMLAEVGIDVVKVEPPAGSAERRRGPFFHDEPHIEKGLYWLAYNTNKRGVTLDIRTHDGQALFRRLVQSADFVIESFPPGFLDGLGLGYAALNSLNPRLIWTSITPFGAAGPYSRFAADDLSILALCGTMNLNGDADRAPIRFCVEQTYPQAGAQAAAATLIAHQHRRRTGQGQHIDVSMQEAMACTNFIQYQNWRYEHKPPTHEGSSARRGGLLLRLVFPCADGHVSWRLFVADQGSKTRALVDWMAEEDKACEIAQVQWEALDMDDIRQEQIDSWEAVFARFFLAHSKRELHRGAVARGIMLFPVNTTMDLIDDEHLAEHRFWQDVTHPALGSLRHPGTPYRSIPSFHNAMRPAPLLGQHNEQVFCNELGLSKAQLRALKEASII